MLEEAPGRVALLTRSLTQDRAKKIDLLAIVAKTCGNAWLICSSERDLRGGSRERWLSPRSNDEHMLHRVPASPPIDHLETVRELRVSLLSSKQACLTLRKMGFKKTGVIGQLPQSLRCRQRDRLPL